MREDDGERYSVVDVYAAVASYAEYSDTDAAALRRRSRLIK